MKGYTKTMLLSAFAMGCALTTAGTAVAQERYLGDIIWVGFNFCPLGTASADGQILPINQNQSLYSLYGTTFGGDGLTAFALPDLRGRMPVGVGAGSGLSPRQMGQKGGSETVTLSAAEVPPHNHGLAANSGAGDSANPVGRVLANPQTLIYRTGQPDQTMDEASIGTAGGSQAHENMQPYQTIKACVVLQGLLPSRS